MTEYGQSEGLRVGTGIAPLPTPPRTHYPGYTPALPACRFRTVLLPHSHARGVKLVVGLKSVAQLSLSIQISGSRGMTEVYNVEITGRINNHLYIVGND